MNISSLFQKQYLFAKATNYFFKATNILKT